LASARSKYLPACAFGSSDRFVVAHPHRLDSIGEAPPCAARPPDLRGSHHAGERRILTR